MKTQQEIDDFLYQNTEFEGNEHISSTVYFFDKTGKEIGYKCANFPKIIITNNRKWSIDYICSLDTVYQIKRGYKEKVDWQVLWELHKIIA